MSQLLTRFIRDESGATAIEYGLIAALIAVVIITALTSVGTSLSAKFKAVATTRRWAPRHCGPSKLPAVRSRL